MKYETLFLSELIKTRDGLTNSDIQAVIDAYVIKYGSDSDKLLNMVNTEYPLDAIDLTVLASKRIKETIADSINAMTLENKNATITSNDIETAILSGTAISIRSTSKNVSSRIIYPNWNGESGEKNTRWISNIVTREAGRHEEGTTLVHVIVDKIVNEPQTIDKELLDDLIELGDAYIKENRYLDAFNLFACVRANAAELSNVITNSQIDYIENTVLSDEFGARLYQLDER